MGIGKSNRSGQIKDVKGVKGCTQKSYARKVTHGLTIKNCCYMEHTLTLQWLTDLINLARDQTGFGNRNQGFPVVIRLRNGQDGRELSVNAF